MTGEQVIKGYALWHRIELCKKDLDKLKSYEGNKRWIGYGQDKGHGHDLSVNTDQFDTVMNLLKALKTQELEHLEKQLENL